VSDRQTVEPTGMLRLTIERANGPPLLVLEGHALEGDVAVQVGHAAS